MLIIVHLWIVYNTLLWPVCALAHTRFTRIISLLHGAASPLFRPRLPTYQGRWRGVSTNGIPYAAKSQKLASWQPTIQKSSPPIRNRATLISSSVLVSPGVGSALAGIVNPECAAVHRLLFQNFFSGRGAVHINEVGVREASRLAGAAVDGDSHVKDVANLPEKVFEVSAVHCEVSSKFALYTYR